MGDINIDLNSDSSLKSDYTHMIKRNAFSCLINKPTREATGSETIIDHLFTNDTESAIIPGVFLYKLANHYAIYCSIFYPNFKDSNKCDNSFTFHSIHSVNGTNFRKNLESCATDVQYNELTFNAFVS